MSRSKRGEKGDRHQFMNVVHELRGQGCDAVILACTELSVLKCQLQPESGLLY